MAQTDKIELEDTEIYSNIAKLPVEMKREVNHFVEFLLQKAASSKRKPKPEFGSGKGLFGKLPDDFDAPLEDFKDYM
jgi:Protein of unknown function (DUF2281)